MAEKKDIFCTDCKIRTCNRSDVDHQTGLPSYCLTRQFETLGAEARPKYGDEEAHRVMLGFNNINPKGITGGPSTRVEMLIKLFRNIGARRIGIATCYAMLNEASVFARILKANGFEVFGINCKVGTLNKQEAGIAGECDRTPLQSSCNPILQAEILNSYATDYNVIVGLCVGHDAIFTRHSKALVSTLVAKDFALTHNPVAALNGSDDRYRQLTDTPITDRTAEPESGC